VTTNLKQLTFYTFLAKKPAALSRNLCLLVEDLHFPVKFAEFLVFVSGKTLAFYLIDWAECP
jgi:surface polysaccharide O-acyltransferase-like enzyme